MDTLASDHILIVEDDLKTAQMLELALVSRGFDCSVAYDGRQAIGFIKDRIPDVVLLDLCLPDINGFEVCTRIRKDFAEHFIPVVILTALDDVKSKVNGLECGADDYITKPYDILEVVARIKSMLRIKSLQDELLKKNKNLEELNNLKDEFLSICSHDLRNIVMPIMEASALMRDNLVPEHNMKFADIIYRQSQKMVGLLNALLKTFEAEQGKLLLSFKKVNVDSFFRQYITDCTLLNSPSGVIFESDIRETVAEWAFDPEKVDEVLTNLVANALKFTKPGGKITLVLDTYMYAGEKYLLMGVKDTGEGIAEDKINDIFNKYVTSNSGKNRLSIGLGLAICKAIVEQHGGSIWVESKPGKGSEFYFILPNRQMPANEKSFSDLKVASRK